MNKKYFIAGAIVVIAVVVFYFATKNNSPAVSEEVAKCIGSRAILYTKTGCFYCQKQEELFGDKVKFLNLVNADSWEDLAKYNITQTPTWIINEEKYVGVQEIETLRNLTGC